jgi:inner membrane protein
LDSLTQLTFGATIGEAVLGSKVGRKAMFWGAVMGTLPDLDVFIPMGGPVNDFVYHRGFSHSIFLLALISPLLAWLIIKIHPTTKKFYNRWVLLTFLVLEASVLLDFLTIYGTQILWPVKTDPLAWPVFFIIDPLFTLPILFGCMAALILSRRKPLGHRLNTIGLVLSLTYTLWAVGAKEYVESRVRDKLSHQHVSYSQLVSTPSPFNTFLWQFVGIDNGRYFETFFSIFDGNTPLIVSYYPRNLELRQGLEHHPPVVKLQWFTRGYYALSKEGKDIVVTDLRMGSAPHYVFRFKVGEAGNPHNLPTKEERMKTIRDWRQLIWIWKRIWTPRPVDKSVYHMRKRASTDIQSQKHNTNHQISLGGNG